MRPGPRSALAPDVPRRRVPAGALSVVLVLVGAGLLQQGAFYAPWDLAVPLAACAVAAVAVLQARGRGLAGPDLVVLAALVAFAAWWAWCARRGVWQQERQPVGSALGFSGCFALGRVLDARRSHGLAQGVLLLGALSGAVGLLALAHRVEPLVLPAQDHLRLAGTVTYSNGTAVLLAVALVVGLVVRAGPVRDAQLVLVVGALCATQSRGGVLAALVGLLAVRHCWGRAGVPVLLGVVLGATAVAGSAASADRPWLPLLAAGLCATAAAAPAVAWDRRSLLGLAATACAGAAAALVAVPGLRASLLGRLGTASTTDRAYEWQAGWQAFGSDVVLGRGPGLRYALADGRTARFVHNEALEVLADVGLVGLLLLAVACAAALARPVGHVVRPAGGAAVLVLLVAGSVDFSWHLPAVVMLVGLAAGGAPADDRGRADPLAPAGTAAPRPVERRAQDGRTRTA